MKNSEKYRKVISSRALKRLKRKKQKQTKFAMAENGITVEAAGNSEVSGARK